jgi:hypothetical protein
VAQWHTYGLEWEPGEIRFYVDGKLYETQNNWYSRGLNQPADYAYPAPFDQPFHMLLNLAVGGNFDGDPDSTTQFPQTMQVDYVRAYQLTKTPTTEPAKPQIPKEPIPDNAIKALPDGNLVHNSDFTETDPNFPGIDGLPNSSYWSFYQGAGGVGSVQVDPLNGINFAKINISTPGSQNYSVQLLHTVSLVKGHYYKLTFDAKSTKSRNVDVKLTGRADRGFVAYSKVLSASLSDQLQSYSLSFQMAQDTDIASRIEFNAGTNANPVWVGNVRLVEIDGLPIDENGPKNPLNGDGNHVYNGTFDEGNSDRMIYWNFNTQNSADATATVDPTARQLAVGIANGGSDSNDITLVQKGMQLIHDQTYQLTFDAKAKVSRDIQVSLISKDGNTEYFKKTVVLGTNMDTQTLSFTMPSMDDNEGQLVFGFGGSNNDVTMDNVKLVMTSTYIDPSVTLFPLINGDFDTMFDPWQGIQTNGGASTATDDNGVAKVSVTNVGDQPYSNMLMQDGLSMSNGSCIYL